MDKPKGTAAAILILIKHNPGASPKQLAALLNITVRRVNQIKHKYIGKSATTLA